MRKLECLQVVGSDKSPEDRLKINSSFSFSLLLRVLKFEFEGFNSPSTLKERFEARSQFLPLDDLVPGCGRDGCDEGIYKKFIKPQHLPTSSNSQPRRTVGTPATQAGCCCATCYLTTYDRSSHA